METLIYLVIGALSGFIAGLVGLAGGIVVVPALTWMYGSSALHDAIIVSWFAVLFNSIGAAVKQYRVRTPQERAEIISGAMFYVLGVLICTPLVALCFRGAQNLITPMLVALLQLCLALVMLWPVAETEGRVRTNKLLDFCMGGLISGVSTLIGVGGGTYTIAYFVYAAKRKFQDAIATANMTGLIIGLLSVLGYLASLVLVEPAPGAAQHASPISTLGMVILIVSGVVFSSLGVRVSRRMPTKVLRKILVVALIVSAFKLMLSA
jgi:uncharacterized membrane protein YfcA